MYLFPLLHRNFKESLDLEPIGEPMSITRLQSKQVASGSGSASATASGDAYASNTTPSSLLVLVARSDASWSSGGSTAPSISTPTTSGFTWTQAATAFYTDATNQNSSRVTIFYIANAGAMSSSLSTSVTATRSGAVSTDVSFTAYEFSGVATSPTDTNATTSSQTSSPITAGSLVTSATALIFAACIAEATVSTGSGFTAGPNTSEQYILNHSSGTISTAFGNNSGSQEWGACAADFLASGSVTLSNAFTFGF